MSDRFKFRVWDKQSNSYTKEKKFYIDEFGGLFKYEKSKSTVYINSDNPYIMCLCSDRYTCEQCTGLKDKNGKLIYEGDIVKCRYYDNFDGTEREIIGKVYWHKEDCAFYIFISLEEEIGFYGNYIDVIGNIHENKELLEEKAE